MKALLALGENGSGKVGAKLGATSIPSHLGLEVESIVAGPDFNESLPKLNSWKNSLVYLNDLSLAVYELFKNNRPAFVISGDHSAAIGIMGGIRKAHPQASIGVIWIDAHADSHSPFTTPSGNLHGMPVSAVLGRDSDISGACEQTAEKVEIWKRLIQVANPLETKTYKPSDFLFLGLRCYEPEEMDFLLDSKIKFLTSDQINTDENSALHEIDVHLLKHDFVFVSFDVDSLDSENFKSTGLPSKNGLKPDFVKKAFAAVVTSPKWIGLELTEVNPNQQTFMDDLKVLKECLVPVFDQLSLFDSKTKADFSEKSNFVENSEPQFLS